MAYVDLNTDPYGGHRRLLRLCGKPRVVLDAGGSSGYVSTVLAADGARVIVVDVDEEAVAQAVAGGREAYRVDLAVEAPPLAPGSVDLLILADVLEHLPDPAATLRRLRPLLADGGRLVASVPNGANWALRLQLLAGRWQYTDRGLLDRTHLRNFTRRSFHECLEEGGFDVVEADLTCPVPVFRGGMLSAFAYSVGRLRPGLFAYQHLALALPRDN
ncbi:MAG: class I SAM-dependent methyltransferase [Candidatus Dormibacter sp.]